MNHPKIWVAERWIYRGLAEPVLPPELSYFYIYIMKLSIVFFMFFNMCLWAQNYQPDELVPDTMVVGNFDGDNIQDTAQLWRPRGHNEMFGCKTCKTEIRFSNGNKTIHHEDDIGYRLENVSDLNQDGIDDLAYCGDWYMGCRRTFEIYLMKKESWTKLKGMEFMACGDTKSLRSRIKILPDHQLKLWGNDIDGSTIFKILKLE